MTKRLALVQCQPGTPLIVTGYRYCTCLVPGAAAWLMIINRAMQRPRLFMNERRVQKLLLYIT